MNKITQWITKISLMGVGKELSPEMQQSIRFSNVGIIGGFLLSLPYPIIYELMGLELGVFGGVIFLGSILYLLLFSLQYHKYYILARVGFLLNTNLLTLLTVILLGGETGIPNIYFLTTILPFFFFTPKESLYKYLLGGMAAIMFISCQVFTQFYEPLFQIPLQDSFGLSLFVNISILISLFFHTYFFYIQIQRKEEKLKEQSKEHLIVNKKLLETNAFLDAAVSYLPIMLFAKDPETQVYTVWNREAEKATGVMKEDILGKTDFDIYPKEEAATYFDSDHQIIKQLAESDNQGPIIFSSFAQKNTFQVIKAPILNQQGELISILGISQDITPNMLAEQELIKAKDEAEQAALTKTQFLANMSHEIRTPMNAVIGMTGLLMDTPLNEEQLDYVETVRMSGDNLLSIINAILDYSKIESGSMELEKQPFTLLTPIEESLDLLANTAIKKGVELLYIVEEGVPSRINGDITRLRQVLVNLVNNAIKFTSSGEILLSVKTIFSNKNKTKLQFSVRDKGIGIPPDRLETLFQPFMQVDASTTRKYGGTGLGLAICQKLTTLMGGEIWVESTVNKGSTFFFTIEVGVPIGGYSHNLGKPQVITGNTILLVDDNPTNLKIMELECKKWGYQPIPVLDPMKVMDILETQKVDLALLDMNMPGMNGIQLAKEIRTVYSEQTLPLIMLTSMGYASEYEDHNLFFAFLTKPIRHSILRNKIEEALQLKSTPKSIPFIPKQEKLPQVIQQDIKILLAEDNMINQKVALRMLEKLGFKADSVANGKEALEAVSMIPYDLVLMDLQMPEMDGLTATHEIKKTADTLPKIPIIIALTANALKEDRQRCIDAGMDDYLAKPVKIEQLSAMIQKWFSVSVEAVKSL